MFAQKDLNRLTRFILVFILLFYISFSNVFAQNEKEKGDAKETTASETVVAPLELSEISNESEDLAIRISKLKQILQPSTKIENIDSLISSTSQEISHQKDSLLQSINNMSQRNLKIKQIEWKNYKANMKG